MDDLTESSLRQDDGMEMQRDLHVGQVGVAETSRPIRPRLPLVGDVVDERSTLVVQFRHAMLHQVPDADHCKE